VRGRLVWLLDLRGYKAGKVAPVLWLAWVWWRSVPKRMGVMAEHDEEKQDWILRRYLGLNCVLCIVVCVVRSSWCKHILIYFVSVPSGVFSSRLPPPLHHSQQNKQATPAASQPIHTKPLPTRDMEPIDNNPLPNSWHPLHFHAHAGDVAASATLLHDNPDTTRLCNLETADGKTPLMLATENGHVAMQHWLLDHGAVIDTAQANTGYTALFVAVNQCQVAAMQALLARGSNVAHTDRWGSTPWITAGMSVHPATFLALFEHLSKTTPREELLETHNGAIQLPFLVHQVQCKDVEMVLAPRMTRPPKPRALKCRLGSLKQ